MNIQLNVLLRNKSHHYVAWFQSDQFSFFIFPFLSQYQAQPMPF